MADDPESVFEEPWVQPGHEVLKAVAEKWASLVICALRRGPKHYGELRRNVDGVSPKMLTQTLRRLERSGLVCRRSTDTVPPRVEYSLTALGQSLVGPLDGVFRWSEHHRDELESARRT